MTYELEICHPVDFPRLFGFKKVPSGTLILHWKRTRGFPESLVAPQGHYRVADVRAWLRAQQTRAEAGQKPRGARQRTAASIAKQSATCAEKRRQKAQEAK
jgi:hypothetical protein